jgi:hypothetical protein
MKTCIVLLVGVLSLFACGGPEAALRTKAAHEFGCPETEVKVEQRMASGLLDWHAEGCGKKRDYWCPSQRGCEARGSITPTGARP